MGEIYPLTIVSDRYMGTYSHGRYTAWELYENYIPDGASESDIECREFWESYKGIVGLGQTPNEALEDLINKKGQGMIEDRQKWLYDHSLKVGDQELHKKMCWLLENNITLSDWQLEKFTGYDRGVGKTYVSMLLNIYEDTENTWHDKDANTSTRRSRDYIVGLRRLKEDLIKKKDKQ